MTCTQQAIWKDTKQITCCCSLGAFQATRWLSRHSAELWLCNKNLMEYLNKTERGGGKKNKNTEENFAPSIIRCQLFPFLWQGDVYPVQTDRVWVAEWCWNRLSIVPAGPGQESSLPAGCSTEPGQSLLDDDGLDWEEPTTTRLQTEDKKSEASCLLLRSRCALRELEKHKNRNIKKTLRKINLFFMPLKHWQVWVLVCALYLCHLDPRDQASQ